MEIRMHARYKYIPVNAYTYVCMHICMCVRTTCSPTKALRARLSGLQAPLQRLGLLEGWEKERDNAAVSVFLHKKFITTRKPRKDAGLSRRESTDRIGRKEKKQQQQRQRQGQGQEQQAPTQEEGLSVPGRPSSAPSVSVDVRCQRGGFGRNGSGNAAAARAPGTTETLPNAQVPPAPPPPVGAPTPTRSSPAALTVAAPAPGRRRTPTAPPSLRSRVRSARRGDPFRDTHFYRQRPR